MGKYNNYENLPNISKDFEKSLKRRHRDISDHPKSMKKLEQLDQDQEKEKVAMNKYHNKNRERWVKMEAERLFEERRKDLQINHPKPTWEVESDKNSVNIIWRNCQSEAAESVSAWINNERQVLENHHQEKQNVIFNEVKEKRAKLNHDIKIAKYSLNRKIIANKRDFEKNKNTYINQCRLKNSKNPERDAYATHRQKEQKIKQEYKQKMIQLHASHGFTYHQSKTLSQSFNINV